MKARIKTPVEHFNGESVGVRFIDGFAEAEINQAQFKYFKSAGYKLVLLEMPKLVEKPAEKISEEKPAKKASPKRKGKRSKKC